MTQDTWVLGRKVERYRVKKVLEADCKPSDGEPFAVTWGAEGWVIWCRTPLHPGGRPVKKQVKSTLLGRVERKTKQGG